MSRVTHSGLGTGSPTGDFAPFLSLPTQLNPHPPSTGIYPVKIFLVCLTSHTALGGQDEFLVILEPVMLLCDHKQVT